MTRDQTAALALLIQRGAGNALDIPHEGNSPEGLAEAALAYARACAWCSGTEAADMRRALNVAATCRAELTAAIARVAALEVALAGVLGAAQLDASQGTHRDNLDRALDLARNVLGDGR